MEIAVLGLGRMGKGIALRLKEAGHDVLGWDRSQGPRDEVAAKGCRTVPDMASVPSNLKTPRVVWIMLPAGEVTESIFQQLLSSLSPGDIIIDGGNSNFKDSVRRSGVARSKGINFIDIGVSGGLAGAQLGYCVMAGGERAAFDHIAPLLSGIAMQDGVLYCGPSGSGHYTKMVHNAIEYGQMMAIGEGFELLKSGAYQGLDLHAIAQLWNHGSIVRGFLMECTENALSKDPQLAQIADYIEDNGEGKWSVQEALEHQVPFVVNTYALLARYLSRQEASFAFKIVAAQRQEFGGHRVKTTSQ